MSEVLDYKIRYLAERAFEVGAVKINLNKPFIGKGGKHIPIRVRAGFLFENYDDRKLIADVMEEFARAKKIHFDFIVGVNTLSLIPGSILANRFNVPLVRLDGVNTVRCLDRKVDSLEESDYVVGASRLVVPYATKMADQRKCKLTYLKPKQCDSDLGPANDPLPKKNNKITMIVQEGDDHHQFETCYLVRQRFDSEMQGNVEEIKIPAHECIDTFDLNRGRGLVIGSLLSHAELFTGDFKVYRRSKASFIGLHLFGYSLRGTDAQMKKSGCYNRSILHLDRLLDVGLDKDYIDRGEYQRMLNWRKNPSRWGARNGFPRIPGKFD